MKYAFAVEVLKPVEDAKQDVDSCVFVEAVLNDCVLLPLLLFWPL